MNSFPYNREAVVVVPAPAQDVFDFLDDPSKLSSHMTRRSWMMGGGNMAIETDSGHARVVGSRLKLYGTVLGLRLSVEEVVTERVPPVRKTWTTIGEPALLVIGPYQMGIEIEDRGESSRLRVWIEYALPRGLPSRWLGSLFGRGYASWCTRRMANDAFRHFDVTGGCHREHRLCWSGPLFPDGTVAFVSSWTHELDLVVLQSEKPWSLSRVLLGIFNVALAGFLLGALFAWCRNLTGGRP